MPLYIIYAWLASFLTGVEVIVTKLISKYSIKNIWLFNYLLWLSTTLFIIPTAIINKAQAPVHWESIIITSFITALVGILYIVSIYLLDVTVLSPLFNFRAVFSVILGVFFLKENLSINQYVLILIIFISGFFVSIDEKLTIKSFFHRSIFIGLILMIVLSLYSLFINISVTENGYWTTILWVNLLAQFIITITVPLFIKDIKKINIKQIGSVGLLGLLGLLYTLLSTKAYSENVGISSIIISLPVSMILAIILSMVLPKLLEKHTKKVYLIRIISATIMFVSAYLLT